ncbi:zonular occludens toxin domain-containing protein [Silvimonas soli]|uniref:zonular occludens toxin domain-containing protein n=1 Tax=Silvimonas soli TaxID=2980100 RepID=UPI0024B37948|nr:zonular occludens toxin domain-containing protein [Silvimonas soli]
MSIYVVTGTLGSGKSLMTVKQLAEYAREGRRIAGNFDIDLCHLTGNKRSKATYSRVPDLPTAADLDVIGNGNTSYDESKNGALILDELAVWMNARSFNDPGRKELIRWFVHARKKGWDVFFLVQHVGMLDNQIREALCEFHAECFRLDKVSVPFVSPLYRMITGKRFLPLPKVHTARVTMGRSARPVSVDRWFCSGGSLYKAYDTKQIFDPDYPHGAHTLLSPWHTHGRYLPPRLSPLSMLWRFPLWLYIKAFCAVSGYSYDFASRDWKSTPRPHRAGV